MCEHGADDGESPVAEDNIPAGRFEDYSALDGTFDDYDDQYPMSEAQLKWYLEVMRAIDEMKAVDEQPYVPVIYNGVKGIFLPESRISQKRARLYHQSLPYSINGLESAADKWSGLVREEVKKALDEYDLVYRLANELKSRGI